MTSSGLQQQIVFALFIFCCMTLMGPYFKLAYARIWAYTYSVTSALINLDPSVMQGQTLCLLLILH